MRNRRRRGAGVAFIIVMCVLVFLSIIGLGVKYFSRGATRVAETVMTGERAVLLARSALDETWAALEGTVNDYDTAMSVFFTKELDKNPSDSFATTYSPRLTRNLCAGDSSVSISDVKVVVPRQFRIWAFNPLEKWGLVGLQVSVSIDLPGIYRSVERTLTEWREFKVVYPSPPPPFDRMTVFVLNPVHLRGYEKQYREIQKLVDDAIKKEEDRLSRKKPFGDVDLPRPFEHNTDVYKYFPFYKYPPFPYNARARKPSSYDLGPPLDETDMDNHLVSFEPELVGEDFKMRWPQSLDQIKNDPLVQQMDAELSAAEANMTSSTADAATVAALEQKLEELRSNDPLKPFETYIKETMARYVKHFDWIKEDYLPEFGARYLAPLIRVDFDGTIKVDDTIAYYTRNRCTHVFKTQDQLWKCLGSKNNVYLDGIYYVDGEVDVDFVYRGKGTIISKNRMLVRRCSKANGPGDVNSLCTLMSFARPDPGVTNKWMSIELDNDVQAGLVTLSGLVKNLHLHNILGTLAVAMLDDKVVDGMHDSAGSTYPWKITYDPELAVQSMDGTRINYTRSRVVIAPTVLGTCIDRGIP